MKKISMKFIKLHCSWHDAIVFYKVNRKILISSLILIYSFTCLNMVCLYAFHNFIHTHMLFTVSEKQLEQKDSCDGNCTIIKVLNNSDQSNATPGIKIQVEALSLHLISDITIPILTNTHCFIFREYTKVQSLHLNRPTPPPEKIS